MIDANESTQSHADIEFDPDRFVTTVTVSSYFPDIGNPDAVRIIDACDPPNWKDAVPSFFVASAPGVWNADLGTFDAENPSQDLRVGSYHLQEQVQWNWSPQLVGGAVNILKIENKNEPAGAPVGEVLAELLTQVKNRLPKVHEHLPSGNAASPEPSIFRHYEYRLVRSVRTKFLTSWQRGGLDVDEGYLKAGWVPQPYGAGTLVIQARKSLHYSARADVVPGLATTLNLMAPALVSLLMRTLCYRAVRDTLQTSRFDGSSNDALHVERDLSHLRQNG